MEKVVLGCGTRVPCAAHFATQPRASFRRALLPKRSHLYSHCAWDTSRSPCGASRNCLVFASGQPAASPAVTQKDFDIIMAAVLGGCARHAYENPPGHGDLPPEQHGQPSVVSVIDRERFANIYEGILEVDLKCGTTVGLRGDKSKTRAILSVGNFSGKTKAIRNTSDPQWNKTFRVPVRDIDRLVLRVYVCQNYACQDLFGSAQHALTDLKQGAAQDLTLLDLEGKKQVGTVTLSVKYVPLKDDEKELPVIAKRGSAAGIAEDWKKLARSAGRSLQMIPTPACFIENKRSGTQVWLYTSNEKEVVISFRGTEPSELEDLKSDILALQRKVDADVMADLRAAKKVQSQDIRVHRGFYKCFRSVKSAVLDALDMIVKDSTDWKVYVTGHSLGGAVGTLCALELATKEHLRGRVRMYNFGTPRVGNKEFAAVFNDAVPIAWRIKNVRDPVTDVPKLQGIYTHSGRLATLYEDALSFSAPEEPVGLFLQIVTILDSGLSFFGKRKVGAWEEEKELVLNVTKNCKYHDLKMYLERLSSAIRRLKGAH